MLSYYDKVIYTKIPLMENFYGYSLGKFVIPSIKTNKLRLIKTIKSHLILLYARKVLIQAYNQHGLQQ